MAPSSTRSPAMSPRCRKATTPGWSATNRWSWWTGTAPATTPARSTGNHREVRQCGTGTVGRGRAMSRRSCGICAGNRHAIPHGNSNMPITARSGASPPSIDAPLSSALGGSDLEDRDVWDRGGESLRGALRRDTDLLEEGRGAQVLGAERDHPPFLERGVRYLGEPH